MRDVSSVLSIAIVDCDLRLGLCRGASGYRYGLRRVRFFKTQGLVQYKSLAQCAGAAASTLTPPALIEQKG